MPASVQVAALPAVAVILCPRDGTIIVSSVPQTLHLQVLIPLSVQVAALVTVHALNLWPVAGTGFSSTTPQMEQIRRLTPSLVQVAATVTFHSPKRWAQAASVIS